MRRRHGGTGLQNHDVVRREVAVKVMTGMQHAQCIEHWSHDLLEPHLIGAARCVGLQNLSQRLPLAILHHHVSRAVLLPKTVDANQRMVLKLRQNTSFLQNALQPGFKGTFVFLKPLLHHSICIAICNGSRQVLLDRHGALQLVITRKIDNREPSLADHVNDFEFTQSRVKWKP